MQTGTKIEIGVGVAAVAAFGIYWFFIRNGEDAAAAITGTKPINEMTPAELKALGGGKLNITQAMLDLLTPAQKAALQSAGAVINIIKEEVVTPATASKGEESPIAYISPRISDGKVTDTNTIEVRILKGVFANGDVVKLNHPSYNKDKEYVVMGNWDVGDGGGSAFLDTPYIDNKGEKNSLGLPYDTRKGTIAVIAEAPEQLEASGGGRKRFLGKEEAKLRKRKQQIGMAQGRKGKALRKFIRTGNQHVMPKKPAVFTQKPGVKK